MDNPAARKPLNAFFPGSGRILFSVLFITALVILLIGYVDRPLALLARNLDPVINRFFSIVTRFGKSTTYLVGFGMAFTLLYPASRSDRWRDHAPALRRYALITFFIFVSIAASGLLVDILKAVFGRYRPVMLYRKGLYGFTFFNLLRARLHSFPSGHANTVAALTAALYFIKPRYALFYLPTALLVMASRVIIGEHFISDVIAGATLGIITTCYIKSYFEYHQIGIFFPASGREKHPPTLKSSS